MAIDKGWEEVDGQERVITLLSDTAILPHPVTVRFPFAAWIFSMSKALAAYHVFIYLLTSHPFFFFL